MAPKRKLWGGYVEREARTGEKSGQKALEVLLE